MDLIFNLCVQLLHLMADVLGMSYKDINVLLFVFIHPAITLLLFIGCLYYRKRYKKALRNENTRT